MDRTDGHAFRSLLIWTEKLRGGFHPSHPSTRSALAQVLRLLVILGLAPLAHHYSSQQALSAWQGAHPPEPALWAWALASRGYRSELASAPPPTKPTPRPRRRRRPADHRSPQTPSEVASPARVGARAGPRSSSGAAGPGGPSAGSRGGGGPELRLPLEAPDRVWWLAEPPRLLLPSPTGPKLYLGPARRERDARRASFSGEQQNQRGTLAAGPTEADRPGAGAQWQDLGRGPGWGALAQFLRVAPALASGQEQALGAGGARQSGGERGDSAAKQAGAPGSPQPGPGFEGARERLRYRDPRRLGLDFAAFPN